MPNVSSFFTVGPFCFSLFSVTVNVVWVLDETSFLKTSPTRSFDPPNMFKSPRLMFQKTQPWDYVIFFLRIAKRRCNTTVFRGWILTFILTVFVAYKHYCMHINQLQTNRSPESTSCGLLINKLSSVKSDNKSRWYTINYLKPENTDKGTFKRSILIHHFH